MQTHDKQSSLETLREIHTIMDRSARFISLSGWSGVWAGAAALAGAAVAYGWITEGAGYTATNYQPYVWLALGVLAVALVGGYFFTARKAKADGRPMWNNATRQLVLQMAIPLAAGGLFSLVFLAKNDVEYVAPACLVFYGLALINGSKYTLSDIKYLGVLQVFLGATNLLMPGWGLYFWATGFGGLHILYGIFMWNKYDNRRTEE
ncbi:MAG: hypothetical protein JNL72_07780 [Flavipsychrobacter sp.]|nr:hypothetical protein [Flavipsychrobacter sp.]